MRTLLHIGQAKTGTTTLQRTFELNRPILEEHGILYPEDPNGRYNNHRLLMGDLFPGDMVPRHILKDYAIEALTKQRQLTRRSITKRIAELNPSVLLLSAESFFRSLSKSSERTFKNTITRIGNSTALIEPIVYLRRPSALYLSALQQKLKLSHQVRQPGRLQTRSVIESYERMFGKSCMHIVAFERNKLKDGDIAADFVHRFLSETGLKLKNMTKLDMENESISFESMDIVRRYRAQFLAQKPDIYESSGVKLVRTLTEIETGLARDGTLSELPLVETPKPRLQPGIAEMCDLKSDQLLWLRDTHRVVFSGVDYSRLERGEFAAPLKRKFALEEVVFIDRSIQINILSALAESNWALNKTSHNTLHSLWIEKTRHELEADDPGKKPSNEL